MKKLFLLIILFILFILNCEHENNSNIKSNGKFLTSDSNVRNSIDSSGTSFMEEEEYYFSSDVYFNSQIYVANGREICYMNFWKKETEHSVIFKHITTALPMNFITVIATGQYGENGVHAVCRTNDRVIIWHGNYKDSLILKENSLETLKMNLNIFF